jgi:hypothetical protein
VGSKGIRVRLRRLPDGTWAADGPETTVTAPSRDDAIEAIRAGLVDGATVVVEEVPDLVGVAEAAELLSWDKRRVATYIRRGSFPEPVASLRAGRVWRREDVEDFAKAFRARQAARARRARRRRGPD